MYLIVMTTKFIILFTKHSTMKLPSLIPCSSRRSDGVAVVVVVVDGVDGCSQDVLENVVG